ncbi:MAG: sugar transferase [Pseudomonadota bacterium]
MKRRVLLIIDICLVAIATLLAVFLRDNLVYYPSSFTNVLPYLCFTLIVAAPVFIVSGASASIWRFSNLNDYVGLMFMTLVVVGGALALSFVLNRLDGVARSVPILQTLLMLMLLVGARVIMRLRHTERRKSPKILVADQIGCGNGVRTLVIGAGPLAEAYMRSAAEAIDQPIDIVGVLSRDRKQVGRKFMQSEVLSVPEELDTVLKDLEVHGVGVDRVVVTVSAQHISAEARTQLERVSQSSTIEFDYLFERLRTPGLVNTSRADETITHDVSADLRPLEDTDMVFSSKALKPEQIRQRSYWLIKRTIDIVGAFCLIIALLPVLAVVGILVAIDMGFPVTFWQQRPGLGGRTFRLYKFRTMAAAHDNSGRKRSDMERTTRLGAFLRRTRLDELPQLFSVLAGDMSFVGPRPLLHRDQSPAHSARLLVRPGMTGWAQVIGGRAVSADDKAALDVWYVRNSCLRLDANIAVRTAAVVLFGERFDREQIERVRSELLRDGILVVRPRPAAPPTQPTGSMTQGNPPSANESDGPLDNGQQGFRDKQTSGGNPDDLSDAAA